MEASAAAMDCKWRLSPGPQQSEPRITRRSSSRSRVWIAQRKPIGTRSASADGETYDEIGNDVKSFFPKAHDDKIIFTTFVSTFYFILLPSSFYSTEDNDTGIFFTILMSDLRD
jgi:hypothetical protein